MGARAHKAHNLSDSNNITNFLLYYIHFYLFSCFHTLYCTKHHQVGVCEIYIKNMSNKNYEKMKKLNQNEKNACLKGKELNQNCSWKSVFTSIQNCTCFTKGYMDNPEGQVQVKSPLTGSCF